MPTVPSTPLSQKPALTPVLPTDRLIGLRTPQNQADATKRVGPVSYVDVAAAVRPLLNLTANNTPGTDKRVRFQTAAQLAAALDGGDCLDALDPTTLVLGGLAWVEFHASLGYGVTLRLLFDGNTRTPAGSGLYAFRTGDLVSGDLVPVRWVQVTGPESGVPSYLQRPSGYVFAVNELVRAYVSGSATEQFFAALVAAALPAPTVAAGDANWRAVAGSSLPTAGGGAFRGAWATVAYALYDCILIPAGNANAGLFAYALAAHSATAPYDPTKWQLDPGQSSNDYTSAEKTKLAGLSAAAAYTLPVATAAVLGGVKQGANIAIAADGTISGTASGPATTDALAEGTTNLYFTAVRSLASLLAGYARSATNRAVAATDSVLVALGVLEKKIDDDVANTTANATAIAANTAAFKTYIADVDFAAADVPHTYIKTCTLVSVAVSPGIATLLYSKNGSAFVTLAPPLAITANDAFVFRVTYNATFTTGSLELKITLP